MSWTPNVPIPDQLSKAPPALTTIGSALHMVHIGDSSNQIWHSVFNGDQWEPNHKVLKQKSPDPPAFSENLMLYTPDDDRRCNVFLSSQWLGGEDWSDPQVIPLHIDPGPFCPSTGYPALARLPSLGIPEGRIVMIFQNGNGSGAIMFRDVFSLSDLAFPTGVLTSLPPALTFHDRTLHMGHHDIRNNHLWHSIFDQSTQTWSQKRIEGQLSFATPALASFNGRLHMVHVGDSSTQIWHSVFDGDQWLPNHKVPKQSSKNTPALAAFNGSLHMVHTGDSSNQLWHSQFQDD